MKKTINDGGPAFPTKYYPNGMSLRDYWAGAFAAALVSGGGWDDYKNTLANTAYEYADAMLAARETPPIP